MKNMSVFAEFLPSFAVAYRLTMSPGTSLKSSSDISIDPSTFFEPLSLSIEVTFSGAPLTE